MIWNVINCIIAGITLLAMTRLILDRKITFNIKDIGVLLIYAIATALTYSLVDNFLKIIINFICNIFLIKTVYKERMEKSIVISFVEYLTILLGECIIGIVCSLLITIIPQILNNDIEIIKNNVILNMIVLIIAYLVMSLFKNQYQNLLKKVSNNCTLTLSVLTLIILICISSLFYKIETLKWKLNGSFLLNTVIIVIVGIVGIYLIIQRLEADKKEKEYKDLAKYSEINASLLEEYSVINHEHKNQLIIIKGMIEENDKDTLEYVKSLIDKKEKVKFKWIRDLNNINFQGLKSFINYKILEMKAENLKVQIAISKDCKEYNLEKLSTIDKEKIYSIMGVYLDNAKEAARESKEKEVIINGYIEQDKLYLEIANTYVGKVDIEKINNYGYTSKGSGHGTGLYMIEQLVKNSFTFQTRTTLQDIYFIQTLIINITKTK